MDRFRPALILAGVSLASVLLLASVRAWPAPAAPLAGTHPSPEALAEAVLAAFRRGAVDDLRALALTEQEFRDHVWPALPASRRERNMPFEFVWGRLHQNSEAHLRQTLGRFGGRSLTLIRVEFTGESTAYGRVRVHRGTRLVLRDPAGREQASRLFGAVVEEDGRFKVFSFVAAD